MPLRETNRLVITGSYLAALTCLVALACDSGKKESIPTQTTSAEGAPEGVLSGEDFIQSNPVAASAVQTAITEQAMPAFEKCGSVWGSGSPHGSALHGLIALDVVSDGKRVRIETPVPPTDDPAYAKSSSSIDEVTGKCVQEAFRRVGYDVEDGEAFNHSVIFPFCIKKPKTCPEGAPLPPLKSQEYFAELPDWNEAIDPRLEQVIREAELASDGLFQQCRCGICRVVQSLKTFEEVESWLAAFQDAVQAQWKRDGSFNMVISSERPIEAPEGFFTHAYLNYSEF